MKAISLLFLVIALVGCKQKNQQHANHDVVYVCSMDPQVRESAPGPCPICHMPLTAVKRSKQEAPGVIELSEQQIKLGGITIDTVGYGNIGNEQTLTGTLVENPENVVSISSRLDGRIEKLYVKAIGETVSKGQPLYRLYSEALYNTQRDYLNALSRTDSLPTLIDFKNIAASLKNKLLLWGVTEKQIAKLQTTRKPDTAMDIYSLASGIVTELYKREGEYLMSGEALLRIADYSTLWATAQLYAYNIDHYQNDQVVYVVMPDGKSVKSHVAFTATQTGTNSQLLTIRMSVPNENLTYRPGTAVTITTVSNPVHALTVPKSSVLYDEMGISVWVRTGDRRYSIRMIEIGSESGNTVEVIKGLVAGDILVVNGAYLLNSEYVFRNGSASMDPNMKM